MIQLRYVRLTNYDIKRLRQANVGWSGWIPRGCPRAKPSQSVPCRILRTGKLTPFQSRRCYRTPLTLAQLANLMPPPAATISLGKPFPFPPSGSSLLGIDFLLPGDISTVVRFNNLSPRSLEHPDLITWICAVHLKTFSTTNTRCAPRKTSSPRVRCLAKIQATSSGSPPGISPAFPVMDSRVKRPSASGKSCARSG